MKRAQALSAQGKPLKEVIQACQQEAGLSSCNDYSDNHVLGNCPWRVAAPIQKTKTTIEIAGSDLTLQNPEKFKVQVDENVYTIFGSDRGLHIECDGKAVVHVKKHCVQLLDGYIKGTTDDPNSIL